MRKLVQTVALLAAVAAALPAFAGATSIAGPNGKIAFASGRASSGIASPAADDSDARIWVADYPSGTPQQVTFEPTGVQHRHPNWSPDHSKIVYAAGVAFNQPNQEYSLWIVDLKTKKSTMFAPLAKFQDRPSWSPDGSKIAYGSNGDLWVKSVEPGATPVQITNTIGITEERAVWSPDGDTLYYNRGSSSDRDLFKKSPVTLAGTTTGILEGATNDWQPSLSPDGKRLCFLRGEQNSNSDLYTVNVDGSDPDPFATEGPGIGELNCVWAPEGDRILYTKGAFGAGQIFTREPDGTDFDELENLNVASHFDGNADWATNFSPECDPKTADVAVNQFTAVKLACVDPDSGFGAAAPTPDPIGENGMEIVTPPAHGTIGSISDDEKVVYTPNKDFKGTDTFTYTAEDNESQGKPATITINVNAASAGADKVPPKISGIAISKKSWRVGSKLASISKAPIGTTISFKLSEAAKAKVSFQRKTKIKGKVKFKNAGNTKALSAKAGANKVKFQGRLTRSKALLPGTYRVVVAATDAAGNGASKNGPTFTIVP